MWKTFCKMMWRHDQAQLAVILGAGMTLALVVAFTVGSTNAVLFSLFGGCGVAYRVVSKGVASYDAEVKRVRGNLGVCR